MVSVRSLTLLAIVACASPFWASAQDARGTITGRITDPSGAAIVRAEAAAVNAETNVRIAAQSNEAGDYEIPYLQPGSYKLVVTMAGFGTYQRTGVEVSVGERLKLDVMLSPGSVNESVAITAETPALDSTSANVGQLSSSKEITELPLSGENSLYVAQLAPGVIYTGAPNHPNFMAAVEVLSSIAVNGTRVGNTEFTIDGVPSMWGTNAAYAPPAATVAEVKVQTATYDATIARAPGGDVNIILKSGGNDIHGSLQWTHTNQHLQGLTLFTRQFLYNPSTGPLTPAKEAQANPLNILNHYGATVSGPVWIPKLYHGRNKTFWMFGFEGLNRPWEKIGTAITVPSALERTGDFSALLRVGSNYQIYDPATIAAATGGHFSRQPFPNNVIPRSRMDKTAQQLLNYWPQPNTAGTADGLSNYTPLDVQINNQNNESVKIDHNLSERHRMFVRYNHSYNLYQDNTLSGATTSNTANRYRFNNGVVFDDVYVISPSMLNDVRIGFTRFEQSQTPLLHGLDLVSAGFSSTLASQVDPRAVQLPKLNISGYQAMGAATDNDASTNYYTATDEFTWNKGPFSFKFGGEYRLYRENNYSWGSEDPTLTFDSKWTNGPLDSSAGSPIGQGLASFLLGLPSGGSIGQNAAYSDQSYNYAFYAQSNWRVSRSLTLNLGLRYDYDSPLTERYNRSVQGFAFGAANPIAQRAIANYALNPVGVPASQFAVNGGLTFPGVNGNPRELWSSSHLNLAPRVALAWQATTNTVVRAGYGIFFVPSGANVASANQLGFSSSTTLNPSLDSGQTFIASLANPFPSGLNAPQGAAGGLSTYLGQAVSFFPSHPPTAYMQRWSASLQRQLPKGLLLDVTYLGNRGVKLPVTKQYDSIPAQYLSTSPTRDQATINFLTAAVANPFYPLLPGTNLAAATVARSQLLLPYPEFTGVSSTTPQGYSWYHSLQVMAQRRFRGGLTGQFNWVFSKFMEATAFQNATDPVPAKVISDLDRKHQLHLSTIYELPFGRGKRFLSQSKGFVDVLAGGWQLEAIWQHTTGAPLGFGNALLLMPLSTVVLPAGQQTIGEWFNVNAFDRKSGDQLANNIITLSSRFSGIRAPGVDIWNMSARKNFQIREKVRLQFHADALDALNHTTLAAPNTTPTSSLFGSINAASNGQPRVLQFGLRLTF
jgi:hypothetical protein